MTAGPPFVRSDPLAMRSVVGRNGLRSIGIKFPINKNEGTRAYPSDLLFGVSLGLTYSDDETYQYCRGSCDMEQSDENRRAVKPAERP